MSVTGSFGGDRIIIALTSDGVRRNKNWCENYRKTDNFCAHFCGKCIGSAFCEYYNSKIKEEVFRPKTDVEDKTEPEKSPTVVGDEGEVLTRREYYVRAEFFDKLIGKTVLVKSTPFSFRIGEVLEESLRLLKISYGGRVHIYDRYTAIKNRSVYLLNDYKELEEI